VRDKPRQATGSDNDDQEENQERFLQGQSILFVCCFLALTCTVSTSTRPFSLAQFPGRQGVSPFEAMGNQAKQGGPA
jgi:hypothetical protein